PAPICASSADLEGQLDEPSRQPPVLAQHLDVVTRPLERDGARVGHLTHKAWSYRLERMIGYALVSVAARPGDHVEVLREDGRLAGRLVELPFEIGR
ncbi:MAG: glycine cleavage T C-terminal barrel domain-containing protein, partial [Pseudomonadota bacterium]